MKKRILFSVLALFLVGVGSLAGACPPGLNCSESGSGSVNVSWTIQGCWVVLCLHQDIDLGLVTSFHPGDELVDEDNNRLMVITNCKGWAILAQVTDIITPPGFAGDVPQDFYWKVERWGTGEVLHDWDSLANRDMVSSPFTIETVSNPGTRNYNIGYKYILDEADIQGDYQVTFTYTATTP
jgi:hypothetical protein